jgi:predicted AAA+ superfamily ATPase
LQLQRHFADCSTWAGGCIRSNPHAFPNDEVQFTPRFEEVLNSLLRMSNIDVYVTGSNSRFLSSDIVAEFRGRGDVIRIYPLSFAEFYSAYDGDYDDAWDDYMTYGGLPQAAGFKSE